jgi:hypothetical protein
MRRGPRPTLDPLSIRRGPRPRRVGVAKEPQLVHAKTIGPRPRRVGVAAASAAAVRGGATQTREAVTTRTRLRTSPPSGRVGVAAAVCRPVQPASGKVRALVCGRPRKSATEGRRPAPCRRPPPRRSATKGRAPPRRSPPSIPSLLAAPLRPHRARRCAAPAALPRATAGALPRVVVAGRRGRRTASVAQGPRTQVRVHRAASSASVVRQGRRCRNRDTSRRICLRQSAAVISQANIQDSECLPLTSKGAEYTVKGGRGTGHYRSPRAVADA